MKVLDREIEKDMTVEIENVDSRARGFGVVTRAGGREFTSLPFRRCGRRVRRWR